jgi:hypothetical protein
VYTTIQHACVNLTNLTGMHDREHPMVSMRLKRVTGAQHEPIQASWPVGSSRNEFAGGISLTDERTKHGSLLA